MAGKGGGGSWKVAYADFVTALMAFFLAMWITAQDKKIREAIAHHFNAPFESVTKARPNIIPGESLGILPDKRSEYQPFVTAGLSETPTGVEVEMLRQINERLLKTLVTTPDQGNSIKLELTGSGLNITVFDRGQKPVFQPQSSELSEFGRWVFTTLAWEIARYKHLGIELEGHTTSSVLTNEVAYDRWDLSAGRANAARRVLVAHGVAAEQVIKVAGFGDTKPMPGSLPAEESNNRVTVQLSLKGPTKGRGNHD